MGHRLLIRGAEVIVTMDGKRRESAGGDVLADSGVIAAVGSGLSIDPAHLAEQARTAIFRLAT